MKTHRFAVVEAGRFGFSRPQVYQLCHCIKGPRDAPLMSYLARRYDQTSHGGNKNYTGRVQVMLLRLKRSNCGGLYRKFLVWSVFAGIN